MGETTDQKSGPDPADRVGPAADLDATAVATGAVVGTGIPVVQYALWRLVVAGPFAGPGADALQAEMALFFAVGVVVPAGGIAALYEDSPVSGVVGTATYPVVGLAVASTVGMPDWVLGAVPWVAVVLGLVAVLGWYDAGRG